MLISAQSQVLSVLSVVIRQSESPRLQPGALGGCDEEQIAEREIAVLCDNCADLSCFADLSTEPRGGSEGPQMFRGFDRE